MPPDLEPASALAERILDDYPNIPGGAKLIEADRAAVREPLERRIAKLKARLVVRGKRIASLEAQLASAREEALREAIAAVEAINADHWATTGGIKARALMVLQSRISFVRNAPPAAQKEPSRG